MDLNQILENMGNWVIGPGVRIFLVLIITLVLIKAARLGLDYVFARLQPPEGKKTKIHVESLKPLLYNFLRAALILLAIGLILEAAGIRINDVLETKVGKWLISSGLKIFLIIAVTVIVLKTIALVLDHSFRRLEKKHDGEMKKRTDTLKAVIRNVANVTLLTIALVMILDNLGVDIGPILATAGVLGVAVGFGAQQLVRDLINGFFILLNDQIRVGDVVEIAGKSGFVENVNLRMTVLRDLVGNVHYVRNGEITVVTNMTKEFSRYVFDVGVAYREDVDEVIAVLKQIDEEMRKDPQYGPDILEPLEVLGLDRFSDSAIIIRVRTKTKPSRQWAVGREFNRRMKKKFDELGIEIPFPHVTLYMGQGKDGSAPPMNLRMVDKIQITNN
jgi:small conductance mechanosensitive channel